MSSRVGETMQNNLSELLKQLNTMKSKKQQLDSEIHSEELQLENTQQELKILIDRLNGLEEFLHKKQIEKMKLDQTIEEAEDVRSQIAEHSLKLLNQLQKSSVNHLSSLDQE